LSGFPDIQADWRCHGSRKISYSIEHAYAGEYRTWKAWQADRFGKFTAADALAFRSELKRSGIPLDRPFSVLEIGFGNGLFASWVAAQGWSFVGTELDPELIRRARTSGLEAHSFDAGLITAAAGRTFDLVVAFDILEHLTLDQIVELLTIIRTILAPRGRFIARFPSGDSPFSRSLQYGDITHKSVIGSGIVMQLALRTGFRVLQVRAPMLPIFGVGWRRGFRRLCVRILQAGITRIVNLGFHDNQPRVVGANMVIVLEPAQEHALTAGSSRSHADTCPA